jgi:malate dehydrogenase
MEGQYGISDVYLGVVAKLGSDGVVEVVESPLTAIEAAGLMQAATAVADKVADLGQIDY